MLMDGAQLPLPGLSSTGAPVITDRSAIFRMSIGSIQGNYVVARTSVLVWNPWPEGSKEILIVAHMAFFQKADRLSVSVVLSEFQLFPFQLQASTLLGASTPKTEERHVGVVLKWPPCGSLYYGSPQEFAIHALNYQNLFLRGF